MEQKDYPLVPAANEQTMLYTAGAIRAALQDLTTALNGLAELPGAAEGPFAQQAAMALRSVYRLQRTAGELELFAQLRAGTYPLRRSRIELTVALIELCGELGELLETAGIELRLRMPKRDVEVCLDWPLTAALLRELVTNAAADAGDGTVEVELCADSPDRVRFTVRNRPAEPLPEPLFHRHAAERSEGFEGLGLGLSLVSAGAACQKGSFLISVEESGELAAVLSLPVGAGRDAELHSQRHGLIDCDENLIALSPVLPNELFRLEDLL